MHLTKLLFNHQCLIQPDINECAEGLDNCAQTCTNTPGYFTCSCVSGFTLNANGFSCDGIITKNVLSNGWAWHH